MRLTQKTFRLRKPKFAFLWRYKKWLLVALFGLLLGAGVAGITVGQNVRTDNQPQNQDGTDEFEQTFDSDEGLPTQPAATDINFAPEALKFSKSTYAVKHGSSVTLKLQFTDKNGVIASTLSSVSVKVSGGGTSKSVTAKSGATTISVPYKGAKVGTHSLTAAASGFKSSTTTLVVNKVEKLALLASKTGTVDSGDVVVLTATNTWSTGDPIVGAVISFTVTAGCGDLTTANDDTDGNGKASTSWTVAVTSDKACTITASSSTLSKSLTFNAKAPLVPTP